MAIASTPTGDLVVGGIAVQSTGLPGNGIARWNDEGGQFPMGHALYAWLRMGSSPSSEDDVMVGVWSAAGTLVHRTLEALREAAREYHRTPTRGKISVTPTKPLSNQRDLSLAYSPGVAYPCLDIQADPSLAVEYTSRGT